jgi:hypothetical protein
MSIERRLLAPLAVINSVVELSRGSAEEMRSCEAREWKEEVNNETAPADATELPEPPLPMTAAVLILLVVWGLHKVLECSINVLMIESHPVVTTIPFGLFLGFFQQSSIRL